MSWEKRGLPEEAPVRKTLSSLRGLRDNLREEAARVQRQADVVQAALVRLKEEQAGG